MVFLYLGIRSSESETTFLKYLIEVSSVSSPSLAF